MASTAAAAGVPESRRRRAVAGSPVWSTFSWCRTGIDIEWTDGRDLWWNETVDAASPEHTRRPSIPNSRCSCSTPRAPPASPGASCTPPAGIDPGVLHAQLRLSTSKPEKDVYWCTADIGWVTGHSYIVYGPLSNGATQVVYEGTPASPDEHRHLQVIEKYGVTIITPRPP